MTKRRAHYAALLVLVVAVVAPSTAGATWGNHCEQIVGGHCYAQAEWGMTGTGSGGGEEVKGLSSEIMTTAMNVPQWQSHAFVTNEQWMLDQNDHWVEDGQLAGDGVSSEEGREVNGASLHWFYAYWNGTWGEYVAPWTYAGWNWISYTLSDPQNNGSWCEKIGEVQVACQGGFKKYATNVKVGMEAADEVQPENAGKDRTGAQHVVDGRWYHWNEAQWITQNSAEEPEGRYVCAKGYESIAGYINWGSPANKC